MRALAPFPRVIEMAQSVSHEGVLGPCDDDVEFAFGLDLILDGLEQTRISDSGGRPSRPRGAAAAGPPDRAR
jgi:hypothetical protein